MMKKNRPNLIEKIYRRERIEKIGIIRPNRERIEKRKNRHLKQPNREKNNTEAKKKRIEIGLIDQIKNRERTDNLQA